jgi:hypothetical protein
MVCSLTSNGLVNRGNRGDCREGEIWFVPACVGVALPAWVAVKGNLYLYEFDFRRRL